VRVTTRSSVWLRTVIFAAVTALTSIGAAGTAYAQSDPNPGALTLTAGLDVPTLYFFRGIRQEADQKLTLWPYGDLGIALFSGDGGLKSVGVNVGIWNSLHTGSSGSDSPFGGLHYEEDFYTTLALGFGSGVGVGTTFTAYTSPNALFTTVKELSFKVTKTHMLAPYGILAFEIGGDESGQADGGHTFGGSKGTYLELGVGPSWPLGEIATLAVPVKFGFSLKDYYERIDENGDVTDEKFGFFDIGGLVTFPLTGIPSSFGAWNFHAGLDVLVFGDTTKAANLGDKGKVVGLFGIGVSY
jgi:hypothetical protein